MGTKDWTDLTKNAVERRIEEEGLDNFVDWAKRLDPNDSGRDRIFAYLEQEYDISGGCTCGRMELTHHAPSGRYVCIFCETDSV